MNHDSGKVQGRELHSQQNGLFCRECSKNAFTTEIWLMFYFFPLPMSESTVVNNVCLWWSIMSTNELINSFCAILNRMPNSAPASPKPPGGSHPTRSATAR